jgi:hypothetical protein
VVVGVERGRRSGGGPQGLPQAGRARERATRRPLRPRPRTRPSGPAALSPLSARRASWRPRAPPPPRGIRRRAHSRTVSPGVTRRREKKTSSRARAPESRTSTPLKPRPQKEPPSLFTRHNTLLSDPHHRVRRTLTINTPVPTSKRATTAKQAARARRLVSTESLLTPPPRRLLARAHPPPRALAARPPSTGARSTQALKP